MSDAGIHIRIITHRLIIKGLHAQIAADTVTSLEQQGDTIPYRDLVFSGLKHQVHADVYVDDAPSVISSLQKHGKDVLIYTQNYNTDFGGPRASNWSDVENHVMTKFEDWQKQR